MPLPMPDYRRRPGAAWAGLPCSCARSAVRGARRDPSRGCSIAVRCTHRCDLRRTVAAALTRGPVRHEPPGDRRRGEPAADAPHRPGEHGPPRRRGRRRGAGRSTPLRRAAVRPRLPRPAARPRERARPAARAAAGRPRACASSSITAYATIDTAVEAMRRGAFDYLPKPFTPDQLRRRARPLGAGPRAARPGRRPARSRSGGSTPEADLDTARAGRAAGRSTSPSRSPRRDATVLLRGESGTGKGVLARAVHARSPRAGRPFVTVHCPSLSAELLESDLFGHVRGAFTGAVRDTAGKVGGGRGRHAVPRRDRRPAAGAPAEAAAAPPGQDVRARRRADAADGRRPARRGDQPRPGGRGAAGRFREDLLYRLNVIEVTLPPLRERRRGRPAAGRPPARVLRPPDRQAGDRLHRRRREAALAGVPLAGQPPRAAQRRRARRDPAPGRAVGLAAPARPARPRRRPAGSRSAGRSRSTSWRPSTSAASWPSAPSLDEAAAIARHRPEHAVPQAEAVRTVNVDP